MPPITAVVDSSDKIPVMANYRARKTLPRIAAVVMYRGTDHRGRRAPRKKYREMTAVAERTAVHGPNINIEFFF